ncbi:cation-translocating P-type ATPase [Methanolobus sp. ZRKC2]|uniref:heavy metal translocating P-type ATPase n=1 Tax=Methanolobus sp. ZRKC2 TaxID=3125783 RepID=UPI00324FB9D2
MNRIKEILNSDEWIILSIAISVFALLVSFFNLADLPIDSAWVAVILCGVPILKESSIEFIHNFDIKADVLVSLALIASVWIGEIFAAGEIAVIMTIGALLEERTVAKARSGIEKLVRLKPQKARLINDGSEKTIPSDQVNIGDKLRVLAGETIPVDGMIISGNTSIDQSVMTGESLPVDKKEGDEVFSGTINQFGTFEMTATKVSKDSSLQRIIRLLESTDAGKAKVVGLADRWATWIVIAALVSAAFTWVVTGEVVRAVTILVVFCPCALVLATPTAIMAGIGNATKYGILIREGDALERLARIGRVAFDKTGTLTHGKPAVVDIESFSSALSTEELLSIAASSELRSEHPLGKAVVNYFRSVTDRSPEDPSTFEMIAGSGVSANVGNKDVLIGNEQFLEKHSIMLPPEMKKSLTTHKNNNHTVLCIAIEKQAVGMISLSDFLREDSVGVIEEIHGMGVKSILLTGDNSEVAAHMAKKAGILNVIANCLPEDKVKEISQYQENGEHVCMLGDGVNDALALKTSNVGIAMGSSGSDIAIDAADVALVGDDIRNLPHLLRLSRKTMNTIKLNIGFSLLLNFVAVILAMTGVLNPVAGALVHNAGSVLVIINSSLLLTWKRGTQSNFRVTSFGRELYAKLSA